MWDDITNLKSGKRESNEMVCDKDEDEESFITMRKFIRYHYSHVRSLLRFCGDD